MLVKKILPSSVAGRKAAVLLAGGVLAGGALAGGYSIFGQNNAAPRYDVTAADFEPAPVPIDEAWEASDVDPELADCYTKVFESYGMSEVKDLAELAEMSKEAGPELQEKLGECL